MNSTPPLSKLKQSLDRLQCHDARHQVCCEVTGFRIGRGKRGSEIRLSGRDVILEGSTRGREQHGAGDNDRRCHRAIEKDRDGVVGGRRDGYRRHGRCEIGGDPRRVAAHGGGRASNKGGEVRRDARRIVNVCGRSDASDKGVEVRSGH